MSRVAVLGVGSWGTALAVVAARAGHDVTFWGWEPDHPEEIDRSRENTRFMPGVHLPDSVAVTADLEAIADCELVIGVVPSSATRAVAVQAAPFVRPGVTWLSATKGLEPGTRRRMTEVAQEVLPAGSRVAVLSGPSFAREVAAGLPTAVVIASGELAEARRLQELLSCPTFRAYACSDVVGVELGGALKNVVAIAAGFVTGLSLGHDALAAVVTRGLREMTLLGTALGARAETFAGLAGLGDLVLTCTGEASRNRRLGEMLARGATVEEAQARLGQVSEGVATVELAVAEGATQGLELPIMKAVRDVIFDRADPRERVEQLMSRALRDEDGWP
jgi:glycerol-3-phosphate dehydrogenase (NAD(P)+)